MSKRNNVCDFRGLLGGLGLILFAMAAAACGVEYPNCETDEDCKEQQEFCVNQLCQQCRSDQDCQAGQSCMDGACEPIPGYCASANDCAPGETCENNRCVSVESAPPPVAPPPPTPTACALQSVYFAYDSSDLEGGSRSQLQANADCIRERTIGSVHLTGMTDPRGTEEYNMALGDRRAQSAMKYLKSLGASANVTYSSMGEEMATGQDESGWSRDRRVDIKER